MDLVCGKTKAVHEHARLEVGPVVGSDLGADSKPDERRSSALDLNAVATWNVVTSGHPEKYGKLLIGVRRHYPSRLGIGRSYG
jgi:hypothetical protein